MRLQLGWFQAHDDIAQMVGKSPTNCRQIFKRSRQHITAQRPRFPVYPQQQEQITAKFPKATTQGDLQNLMSLLAKDITYELRGLIACVDRHRCIGCYRL